MDGIQEALGWLLPAIPAAAGAGLLLAGDRVEGDRAMRVATTSAWAAFGIAALALLVAGFGGEPGAGSLLAADRLGALMAVLVALVAAVVHSFSVRYMQADGDLRRYAGRLALLTGAVLAIVLARHVAVMATAWVASGVLLAALVGHARGWAAARAGAGRARFAFALGDASLVAGLLVLSLAAGTPWIPELTARAGDLGPWLLVGLALVSVGALARSAVFPMHGWLLTSMVAPTPVSALMHAGLVNAGGFLVARLAGLYGAAPEVLAVLFALGAVTAAVGAAAMLVQPDVKRSLGASTMAQMGFMMMQCGLGAFVAAIYHLVAHGLFKATLFLGAGSAVEGRPAVAPRTQAPGALGWGATAVLALSGTALFALVSGKGLGSGADAVLLAFVLVTAAHASLSSFRSMPTGRALPAAGVAVIGGALLYGVGLAAFGAFLGPVLPEAPQPLGALHAAVALGFVGAWFAGQILPGSLPPALYARLLAFGLKADCTDIAARRTPA